MAVAADLEVRVVLLTAAASTCVESGAVDVIHGCKIQERRVPAIAVQARIEPILGSRESYQLAVGQDGFER